MGKHITFFKEFKLLGNIKPYCEIYQTALYNKVDKNKDLFLRNINNFNGARKRKVSNLNNS